MSIYAISDLHLANRVNCNALIELPYFKDDWLLLAGDIGETEEHLQFALSVLTPKFKRIVWTPGNHDLWTYPLHGDALKGERKYQRLVSICREFNASTPEDEYPIYIGDEVTYRLIPSLTLYDYSFKPSFVQQNREVEWASELGIICSDEELLKPEPYRSVREWCYARCLYTEQRLMSLDNSIPNIIINHYPMLYDLSVIKAMSRFSIWSGTAVTEKWLKRYNIKVAIYGHLHIRSSKTIDGVRHEEVSFGYPNDWDHSKNLQYYLRKIA